MASVTGRTAESIDALMDEMVVSVFIDDNGQLIYQTRGGEQVNAGSLTNAALAVEKAWPINSIFITTVPTNPHTLLGIGTWTRFAKGRTLVSLDEAQEEFNAAEETGGVKEVALSAAQMPAHTHTTPAHTHNVPSHTHGIKVEWGTADTGSTNRLNRVGGAGIPGTVDTEDGTTQSSGTLTTTPGGAGTSGSAGAGDPHTNLPPYVVVYMWKRTA